MTTDNYDYLNILANPDRPKIRKEHFEKNFLPLIINGSDPSVFNLRWLNEVAISPYLEVEVINSDNSIAYIVPPLRRQVNTQATDNLQQMAQAAKLEHRIHHLKGVAFMNTNLPRLLSFADARDQDIQQRWMQLLLDLGYGHLLADTPGNNKSLLLKVESVEMLDEDED